MHVAAGGQARSDVEELADPGLTPGTAPPAPERPVGTSCSGRARHRHQQPSRGFRSASKLSFAAEQVVKDPSDVRDSDV